MGKISYLIDEFNRTGEFSELLERLDVLIKIRNGYVKDDWRVVDVCGYTTHYIGAFLMSPIGSKLKSFHVLGEHEVVMHEHIRRERAVDLADMRVKLEEQIAEFRYAVDCINLEIGYKL